MKEKKYEQLYNRLKQDIRTGRYRAGEKLPSKRTMADQTGYSLITVEKAYGMLSDEGYLLSRMREGYFVQEIDAPATLPAAGPGEGRLPETRERGEEGFEYSVWCKTVRKVLAEKGGALFIKSPSAGCAVLRNAIADYLQRYRGMRADARRIVIGSGAEQLYEDVVKLFGRQTVIGIEDPSYAQIRRTYEIMGGTICPLALGEDGIRQEELEQKHFSLLHVTPFHSYPSGVSTSMAKRQEYLRWAKRTGGLLIEDDFDSEFFLPGHPIETLYSLGGGENVLYLNTFSKSLSPAMRIGYMILPPALLPRYEQMFCGFSCSVPVMDQYILAEFISSGAFERHLNRVRRRLKRQ